MNSIHTLDATSSTKNDSLPQDPPTTLTTRKSIPHSISYSYLQVRTSNDSLPSSATYANSNASNSSSLALHGSTNGFPSRSNKIMNKRRNSIISYTPHAFTTPYTISNRKAGVRSWMNRNITFRSRDYRFPSSPASYRMNQSQSPDLFNTPRDMRHEIHSSSTIHSDHSESLSDIGACYNDINGIDEEVMQHKISSSSQRPKSCKLFGTIVPSQDLSTLDVESQKTSTIEDPVSPRYQRYSIESSSFDLSYVQTSSDIDFNPMNTSALVLPTIIDDNPTEENSMAPSYNPSSSTFDTLKEKDSKPANEPINTLYYHSTSVSPDLSGLPLSPSPNPPISDDQKEENLFTPTQDDTTIYVDSDKDQDYISCDDGISCSSVRTSGTRASLGRSSLSSPSKLKRKFIIDSSILFESKAIFQNNETNQGTEPEQSFTPLKPLDLSSIEEQISPIPPLKTNQGAKPEQSLAPFKPLDLSKLNEQLVLSVPVLASPPTSVSTTITINVPPDCFECTTTTGTLDSDFNDKFKNGIYICKESYSLPLFYVYGKNIYTIYYNLIGKMKSSTAILYHYMKRHYDNYKLKEKLESLEDQRKLVSENAEKSLSMDSFVQNENDPNDDSMMNGKKNENSIVVVDEDGHASMMTYSTPMPMKPTTMNEMIQISTEKKNEESTTEEKSLNDVHAILDLSSLLDDDYLDNYMSSSIPKEIDSERSSLSNVDVIVSPRGLICSQRTSAAEENETIEIQEEAIHSPLHTKQPPKNRMSESLVNSHLIKQSNIDRYKQYTRNNNMYIY